MASIALVYKQSEKELITKSWSDYHRFVNKKVISYLISIPCRMLAWRDIWHVPSFDSSSRSFCDMHRLLSIRVHQSGRVDLPTWQHRCSDTGVGNGCKKENKNEFISFQRQFWTRHGWSTIRWCLLHSRFAFPTSRKVSSRTRGLAGISSDWRTRTRTIGRISICPPMTGVPA